MKEYKISYMQIFSGKVLKESYIRTCKNESELQNEINALYLEDHVFRVSYEEM